MAGTATNVYKMDPELYSGYQNLKTGKILAIIGIILSAIYLGFTIYLYTTVGMEGILQMNEELIREYRLE